MTEVLPYLEVNKVEKDKIEEVVVPNITGLSLKEAKEKLKTIGLDIAVQNGDMENIDKKELVIKEQIPTEGIKINKGNKVLIKY